MKSHVSQDELWASAVSARLRTIQASFADDEPASREGFLAEELEAALRTIPESRRHGYLLALSKHFPTPAAEAQAKAEPAPSPQRQSQPQSFPQSPEALVNHLRRLPPSSLEAVMRGLADLDLLPKAAAAAPVAPGQLPSELVEKLGIPQGHSFDTVRAARLLAELAEFFVTLDHLAWAVWKNLAPNSVVRRDSAVDRAAIGAFLGGDREISTAQLTQAIDRSRQIIAGLMAAIGATGESFARQYLSRFSPVNIKQLAEADAGFLLGSDQKCWRKYVELFNEVSGVQVEREIADTITRYTERLILGSDKAGETDAGQ